MSTKTHYQLCEIVAFRGFRQQTRYRYVPCGPEGINHEDRYDYMLAELPEGFMVDSKEDFLEIGTMSIKNGSLLTIMVHGIDEDVPSPVLRKDSPVILDHIITRPEYFFRLV